MKNQTKLPSINWVRCNTAKPALASTGISIQQAYQCLTTWRMDGMLAQYVGPPDVTINGGVQEAYNTNKFFIIGNMPPLNHDTFPGRPLMAGISTWLGCTTVTAKFIKWRPDFDNAGTEFTLLNIASPAPSNNATYGDVASGETILLYDHDGFYFQSTSTENDFQCGLLTCENMMVAALGVAHAPWPEDTLEREEVICTPGDVSFNKVIKGYDPDDADCNEGNSLGGLFHIIAEPQDAIEYHTTVEHVTRRCLFQWCHPVCLWADQTEANLFGNFTFRVRARNLFDQTGGVLPVMPGLVVSKMGEDDVLRYESVTTGYYWEYTASGDISAPTLIQWDDGIGYTSMAGSYGDYLGIDDDGYDEVLISYTASDAAHELELNTVALFEGQTDINADA